MVDTRREKNGNICLGVIKKYQKRDNEKMNVRNVYRVVNI